MAKAKLAFLVHTLILVAAFVLHCHGDDKKVNIRECVCVNMYLYTYTTYIFHSILLLFYLLEFTTGRIWVVPDPKS